MNEGMDEEKKSLDTRTKAGGMSAPGLAGFGGNGSILGTGLALERPELMDQKEQARILAANRTKLEHMDRNISEVVASIKSEINFAAKRDAQLVERKKH